MKIIILRMIKKVVLVLLTVWDIYTINHPKLQFHMLTFGTFRGIFGPTTQLSRPVPSDCKLILCHFDVPNFPHDNKLCLRC